MIVITGASSGLGLALAKLYQESKKMVVNIALEESEFADVNIVCDLSEGLSIKQAAEEVKQINEQIEAVVNCVGVYSNQQFGEITEEETEKVMATNVKAPLLLVSELMDRIKQDQTDILNVVSTAGTQMNMDNPLYTTSKWGERGFTLSLQDALKNTPSRVISFCPGGINTDLVKKVGTNVDTSEWMSPKAVAIFIKQILELPKNMEVSEVIINRKTVS